MSSIGNKEVFAKNLAQYIDKSGKDRIDLCKALDIKYSTLTEWINARKYPRIDKIELLANYFGIQKSDLIEDRSAIREGDTLYPVLEQAFRNLSDSKRLQVLDYMKYLADKEKSEQ